MADNRKMREIFMRTFNYSQEIQNLLTPKIVQLLTCIHEHKGRQDLFLEANTDELKTLVDVAMIQSTGASNRIEGIFTSGKRLEALVRKKLNRTIDLNRKLPDIVKYSP